MTRKPHVAIVGAGSLANSLAPALREGGYTITEILHRDSLRSRRDARRLAAKVGARVVSVESGDLNAELLWLCVPDREIRGAAETFAARDTGKTRFAFHSSGALTSSELNALRQQGSAVASVHPLMTFVPNSRPSLSGVPFALEGDVEATRVAGKIVRDLGGEAFKLAASRKAAYHAWATLTSPLLLTFFVTLEDAARAAGLGRKDARRKSLPIVRQTLENYARLGPEQSFSGPIIRGDVDTVAKHLATLHKNSSGDVYVALARSALRRLPAKNRKALQDLLRPRG